MNKANGDKWQEQRRAEDGTFLAGKAQLPANHRLRAEALAGAGKTTDPDGIISDELISATAERLEAEVKDAAAGASAETDAAGAGGREG